MMRMIKRIIIVCILFDLFCLTSYVSYAKTIEKKLTPTINKLAFEMLRDEEISPAGQNALFSPYSYANPMAALYIGSAEETKKEFEKAFNFDLNTKQEFKELKISLDTLPDKNEWTDVGRLFANKNTRGKMLLSFQDYLANFLHTDLVFLDFTKEVQSAEEINSWVASATKKMINQIVEKEDVTPATSMILVNAIHFKAPWQDKFLKENTKELYFHSGAEQKQKIPFLAKSFNRLDYYEDETLSAISVPYEGRRIAFMVILPREGQNLSDFLPSLNEQKFEKFCNELVTSRVDVSFPRFKTEHRSDLTDFTTSLVPRATNSILADFSNMTGRADYYIGKVIQKAAIDVTEDGTEASAATSVQMMTMSAPPRDKKIFCADRPFVYLIYNSDTRTILFIGKFEEVEKKEQKNGTKFQ